MSEVRRHQRRTASGKKTTVRHHTRSTSGGSGSGEDARQAWAERVEMGRNVTMHVSSLPPAEPAAGETWWDDDEPQQEAWMADDDDESFREQEAKAGPGYDPGNEWHREALRLRAEREAADAQRTDDDEAGLEARTALEFEDAARRQREYEREDADPKAARARYKAAREALADNAEWEQDHGIDYETDRYHELNDEYWEARKNVPWWRRG